LATAAVLRDDARMRRIRFVVTGRVQGVGFRAHTQYEARQRGLAGTVWNRQDGAVEGEAEGRPEDVTAFAAWLRKGPPGSRVDGLELEDVPVRGGAASFEVRRGRH
jgi:acylphosphatase